MNIMKKSTETIKFRVRYQETDQMGVVYYANYLVWFEMVRTEFFRSRGVAYRELEKEYKIFVPVVESHCRYKIPLRYDDLVTVIADLIEINERYIVFDYEVKNDGNLTTTGSTKHVFVNQSGKPIRIPEFVLKAFK